MSASVMPHSRSHARFTCSVAPSGAKIWVLCGDSEFAEGSIWEALDKASVYKLDNLVAILDMNRLVQRGHLVAHAAVEDRPAVLALADLQERGVLGGVDRVALRVDQVQVGRLADDLAAEQEVDVEAELVALVGWREGAIGRL